MIKFLPKDDTHKGWPPPLSLKEHNLPIVVFKTKTIHFQLGSTSKIMLMYEITNPKSYAN